MTLQLYWDTVATGEPEAVKRMLDDGSVHGGVHALNRQGCSALLLSCRNGHMSLAKSLIEWGARVNTNRLRHRGESPLMYAARSGSLEVVKIICETDSREIGKTDFAGRSPLMFALENDSQACVAILLQQGDSIAQLKHKDTHLGRSPILWAAYFGATNSLALLLASGAHVNEKDGKDGKSALSWAISMGHIETAMYIIEWNSSMIIDAMQMNYATTADGNTPLHYACQIGDFSLVCQLLQVSSLQRNSRNLKGETPIMFAAKLGHSDVVKALCLNRAELGLTNNEGWTALTLASLHGRSDTVATLLSRGAEVHEQNSRGSDSLLLACCGGHYEVIKTLLHHGANPNTVNDLGHTSLTEVCRTANRAAIKLLVKNRASLVPLGVDGGL